MIIYRNAGVPYPVAPGLRHGSIDQYRSVNAGYRKHSDVLRVKARDAYLNRTGMAPYDPNADYPVFCFYID